MRSGETESGRRQWLAVRRAGRGDGLERRAPITNRCPQSNQSSSPQPRRVNRTTRTTASFLPTNRSLTHPVPNVTMDQYFLERHYQRLEESQARAASPSQPVKSSPTRGRPVGKANSEPALAPSDDTRAGPAGGTAAPSKIALLQGGIKQANKATWSKSLRKEGNPITHSDAVARTSHVQVSGPFHSRVRRGSIFEREQSSLVRHERG